MDLKDLEAQYYTLDEFKFENGRILKDQVVEYTTFGKPQYDDEGHIINAILYFHGTTGDYGSIKRISKAVGSNLPFDPELFFFISLSTLGSPGSCSPSTSNLEADFPSYTILDMVNFNKVFIEEKFNIKHLKGVIGNSMGGFEAISWACNYPDSIDFLISLVSSYKVGGQNYVLSQLLYDIIESDPNFHDNPTDASLIRSLEIASKATYSFGLSRQFYMDQSNCEIKEAMDEFAHEDSKEDVYDTYYRCVASMNHDLTDIIDNITAKTMIIAIYEDQYFPPELDAIPMHTLIPGSKLTCFNSYLGHVGSSELDKIQEELEDFMKQFK